MLNMVETEDANENTSVKLKRGKKNDCLECNVGFKSKTHLYQHLLHHIKQPTVVLFRQPSLEPIRLTIKNGETGFTIVTANDRTHSEHSDSNKFEDLAQIKVEPGKEDESHEEECDNPVVAKLTEVQNIQENRSIDTISTKDIDAMDTSLEDMIPDITAEISNSDLSITEIANDILNGNCNASIPGSELTPPPDPVETPKIRIKTGLLRERNSNDEDCNSISNLFSNNDRAKDLGFITTDIDSISSDNQNNALQIFRSTSSNTLVSSNPLDTLSNLPMQQLAQQVSRLQPSTSTNSGLQQQNVLINIQQFPQAPAQPPPAYPTPMYAPHPPPMYQPFQYQPPGQVYYQPTGVYPAPPPHMVQSQRPLHMPPPPYPHPQQRMMQPPQPSQQFRQSLLQQHLSQPTPLHLEQQRQQQMQQQKEMNKQNQIQQQKERNILLQKQHQSQNFGQDPRLISLVRPRQMQPQSRIVRPSAPGPSLLRARNPRIMQRQPRPQMATRGVPNRVPALRNAVTNIQNSLPRRPSMDCKVPLKRKKLDVLLPDQHEDADCQIVAVTPKNTGLPQIQSIQGNVQEPKEDKIVQLSDSITLSLKNPAPKEAPKSTENAKDVADILAIRGITVTAAPKTPKDSEPATSSDSVESVSINLNSSVCIIPKPKTDKTTTVDLTDDQEAPGKAQPKPSPATQAQKQHNAKKVLPFECELCPAKYPNLLGLQKHKQSYHKLENNKSEFGIPLIDLSQPNITQKLLNLGISHFVPLPGTSSNSNNFVLPIININDNGQLDKNGESIRQIMSSVLSLGPIKSIQS